MCEEWKDVIISRENNAMVFTGVFKHEEYLYTRNEKGEVVKAEKTVYTEDIVQTIMSSRKNSEKAANDMANSGNSSYGYCIY